MRVKIIMWVENYYYSETHDQNRKRSLEMRQSRNTFPGILMGNKGA